MQWIAPSPRRRGEGRGEGNVNFLPSTLHQPRATHFLLATDYWLLTTSSTVMCPLGHPLPTAFFNRRLDKSRPF
jgi:hypothetical protein